MTPLSSPVAPRVGLALALGEEQRLQCSRLGLVVSVGERGGHERAHADGERREAGRLRRGRRLYVADR